MRRSIVNSINVQILLTKMQQMIFIYFFWQMKSTHVLGSFHTLTTTKP